MHQEVELKLTIAETIAQASGLKAGVRIRHQDMCLRLVQTERSALGVVFHIDLHQLLIHFSGQQIGFFLRNFLVDKFKVEMVFALANICESHKELGF